jgi:drug/metabolite transporter (DMT)-like permease
MEAILFALVAHVGWGTGDIFGAVSARKIGGYSTSFWSYVVRIPILAFFIPFDMEHVSALTLTNFAVSGLLSLVLLLGSTFHFEAFNSGNPSVIGTIGSAFTVPTVILSVIFFDERLGFYQILAIAVIVVGLVFTTLDFQSLRQKKFVMDSGIILALLAMLFWGVYFAFIRIPVEEIGWFLPGYIGYFFTPAILLLMRRRRIKLQMPMENQALPSFLGLLILGTAANFSYNIGISSGFTSIVAPIAGAYPILFVFLSTLVFKEPLQKSQIWGIVISLAGIVVLALIS